MKADIRVAIFDFDGVIVDSGGDIADAVNYTLERYNRQILPTEEVLKLVGFGSKTLIKKVFPDVENNELFEEIYSTYYDYYMAHCVNKTVLYDGVQEIFDSLKENKIDIAIMTNKPEGLTKTILDKLDAKKYVSCVVGPESISALKPDPEGIEMILEQFECEPENAIMVGDSYTDIIAGRAAETWTCAVTYGIGDTRRLLESEPDFTIDSIKDLLENLVGFDN